ncbi:MAG: FKBP-type peptidyl-prolyl cis-trans isomerase [Myxococcota bacterium]|nr:FKBP-type peptidyl-prolyl cis-trans isomerase [Myxococcota bacterium]
MNILGLVLALQLGCQDTEEPKTETTETTSETTKTASKGEKSKEDKVKEALKKRKKKEVEQVPPPADVASPPSDAKKTASGLAYKVLSPGSEADKPSVNAKVKVHYTGWTTDGKTFDSSVTRGRPASFSLGGVIAGWTEGLQLMTVGEKTRFWIPEELAYKGRPNKPAGMLVFDVELLEITEPPPPPKDVAAPPADAKKTASGLAYKVLASGKGGDKPSADAKVRVHYTGWTTDGKMFDSSVVRGQPISFSLGRVIAGWTEGLQLMTVGEKTRFWIPEELAYKGQKGAPAGMLVFDVELLEITEPPPPLPAPADVASPPSDAKKTASGLAYKVLSPGTGAQPVAADKVQVHYTGWTTDGKMFDSSVVRGKPTSFPLKRVIAGWTEGLQLMKEGEKTRFWIPQELAYKGQKGAPAGMLVFDVELLKVIKTSAK